MIRRLLPVLFPISLAADIVRVTSDAELKKALGGLRANTTLQIHGGEYRGGWAVSGVDGLIVEGADPDRPPHFKGGKTAWQFSRCSNLTVRHLRISEQKNNGLNIDDGGRREQPVTGVRVSHLTVTDIGPRGNFDAIKCSGIDDLQVTHCKIAGWGGQAIDFVGCHRALISNCHIQGKSGFSQSTGPQFKGGSSDVVIENCLLENAGMRPIQAGGSTGMPYFRPPGAKYEARRIIIRKNTIVGGMCAVTFTGVNGAEFSSNTIVNPDKWIFRILQETTASGFTACRNVNFHNNIVSFERSKVRGAVNIGANTAAETFRFKSNLWFASDSHGRSKPRLPSDEADGIYGIDPKLDPGTHRPANRRARELIGMKEGD